MRICVYCGCRASDNPRGGFTFDHFIPQSEGGLEGENLVLCCNPCNNIKGKTLFQTIEEARPLSTKHYGVNLVNVGLTTSQSHSVDFLQRLSVRGMRRFHFLIGLMLRHGQTSWRC